MPSRKLETEPFRIRGNDMKGSLNGDWGFDNKIRQPFIKIKRFINTYNLFTKIGALGHCIPTLKQSITLQHGVHLNLMKLV